MAAAVCPAVSSAAPAARQAVHSAELSPVGLGEATGHASEGEDAAEDGVGAAIPAKFKI